MFRQIPDIGSQWIRTNRTDCKPTNTG